MSDERIPNQGCHKAVVFSNVYFVLLHERCSSDSFATASKIFCKMDASFPSEHGLVDKLNARFDFQSSD